MGLKPSYTVLCDFQISSKLIDEELVKLNCLFRERKDMTSQQYITLNELADNADLCLSALMSVKTLNVNQIKLRDTAVNNVSRSVKKINLLLSLECSSRDFKSVMSS